jgi:hypothetical protein
MVKVKVYVPAEGATDRVEMGVTVVDDNEGAGREIHRSWYFMHLAVLVSDLHSITSTTCDWLPSG